MDRSPLETPRKALVVGSVLIVLLTVLWSAAFDVLVHERNLLESWAFLAETGEAGRLALVAVATVAAVVVLVALGWVWIGRRPRIAPWIRRWAVVVFLLSTVFLVVTTYLPWTARMAARGHDA